MTEGQDDFLPRKTRLSTFTPIIWAPVFIVGICTFLVRPAGGVSANDAMILLIMGLPLGAMVFYDLRKQKKLLMYGDRVTASVIKTGHGGKVKWADIEYVHNGKTYNRRVVENAFGGKSIAGFSSLFTTEKTAMLFIDPVKPDNILLYESSCYYLE